MADFKGIGPETVPQRQEYDSSVYRPLFEEDFDPGTQGGIVVDQDGFIAEVMHPAWVQDGKPNSVADRTTRLPFQCIGDEIIYVPNRFDPARTLRTYGSEVESAAMTQGHEWHKIQPNGTYLVDAEGSTYDIDTYGTQPELLQCMFEYGTPVAVGPAEFKNMAYEKAQTIERMMGKMGLIATHVSVFPEQFSHDDISDHGWVRHITKPQHMPRILEFGVMSIQGHVEIRNIKAAMKAMNAYQQIQALFGYFTAASPIRDGSFDTNLHDHFMNNEAFKHAPNPMDYQNMVPPKDIIMQLGNRAPYDWREISRALGSTSSGAFKTAAPSSIIEMLQMSDKQLRNGAEISSLRVFGRHCDRLRTDKNTVEICNMGVAGGNMYKQTAAMELAMKFFEAAETYYAQDLFDPRFDHLVPPQDNTDAIQLTRNGHINNAVMAMFGAERDMLVGMDGRNTKSYVGVFEDILNFTETYCDEGLSEESLQELAPMLQTPPPREYNSVDEVFSDFYTPGSSMTATDALRTAYLLNPDIPVRSVLARMAEHRTKHVDQLNDSIAEATLTR